MGAYRHPYRSSAAHPIPRIAVLFRHYRAAVYRADVAQTSAGPAPTAHNEETPGRRPDRGDMSAERQPRAGNGCTLAHMFWLRFEVAQTDECHWLHRPTAHSGGRFPRQYTHRRRTCRPPWKAGRSTCRPIWVAKTGLHSMMESMPAG